MEPKTVRDLKKGEYFTRKPVENPTEKQVWVRGEYDRSARGYECINFADVGYTLILKGCAKAYTDFTF